MRPIRHKEQPPPLASPPTCHIKKIRYLFKERQKIIRAFINEGDTYSTVPKRFMLPCITMRSIFIISQNTNRASNLPKGGSWGPHLKKEHLECLMARLLDDRDIPIIDLHCQLNKHFRLIPPVSRSTVQNAVNNRIDYLLMLNHPEPVNYNGPDRVQSEEGFGHNWYTSAPTLWMISYTWTNPDSIGISLGEVDRALSGFHPVRPS